jgi:hypothetical protein
VALLDNLVEACPADGGKRAWRVDVAQPTMQPNTACMCINFSVLSNYLQCDASSSVVVVQVVLKGSRSSGLWVQSQDVYSVQIFLLAFSKDS